LRNRGSGLKSINHHLDELCQNFIHVIRTFVSRGILTNNILQDFTESRLSLHGILGSAFVAAGWRMNLAPVIEPRVTLSTPLDPGEYCEKLKGKRRRHQFRPDIGYYRGKMLDTFAECCTMDEASDYESSMERTHVTKRDNLLHFAKYAEPGVSAIIICVVLPTHVTRPPPWRWARGRGSDFFASFNPGWNKLAQDLQQHVPTKLFTINEKGVYINNMCYPY